MDTNPFNLRRILWHDSQGRLCKEVVDLALVADQVDKLKVEGVKCVEVQRLIWTRVYELRS